MIWFKHKTGSHDDPDISDAWDELGDFGYVGFFVILEIYGQEYNHRNSEDYIRISKTFLRRKLRKSWTKVELLLHFYQHKLSTSAKNYKTEPRIMHKIDDNFVLLKVPKFIEIASNWAKRIPTEVPTEVPTAKEVEEDKEEDKDISNDISKKSPASKKIKFLDFVLLYDDEMEKLNTEYHPDYIKEYMNRLNEYIGSKGKRYKSHYMTLRGWMRKDGIFPISEIKTRDDIKCQEPEKKGPYTTAAR